MSKAVVFAYSSVGCECLSVLLRRGVDVALVYTHQDDPNEERWFDSVYDLARSHGLTVLTEEPDEARVREAAPDVIFSFYYRAMLPMSILSLAPLGAFNMHGSLLPRYRGRACVNWAVLNGETETGVTLHHMTEYADRGNIVAQQSVSIGPDETAHDVFLKIIPAAGTVLNSSLDDILSGNAPGVSQDESKATKFGRRRPADGLIDWTKSAAQVHNLVRAVTRPFPGAFTYKDGKKYMVWRSRPLEERGQPDAEPGTFLTPSLVQTGQGILEILDGEIVEGCDKSVASCDCRGTGTSRPSLAIKIDIDTLKGYREGLPRLLDILKAHGVRASIFFSMGPDNSGKALRRIFRKGFISKMFRTRAPSTYGLKTLFYGTLLPAPMIVASAPDLLRRAIDEGHDCGIHSWDHVYWQDNLSRLSRDVIREQLERAMTLFEKITGTRPTCCAAPGWQVTPDSLAVQDDLAFAYCSDTRGGEGSGPFTPRMGGMTFRTPQIPSTLPTLDEVLGLVPREGINDYYMGLMRPGLNVHTIHTEMEGGVMSGVFEDLLGRCEAKGMEFVTLREALPPGPPPPSEIEMRLIPGRAGTVAVQV